MANILVYIEVVDNHATPLSLSALAAGRVISSQLGATLCALLPCVSPPSYGSDDIIAVVSRHGADKVILVTHPTLTDPAFYYNHEQAVLAAHERVQSRLIIFPDSVAGQDIAPRIAFQLNANFYPHGYLDDKDNKMQLVCAVFRRRFQVNIPLRDARGTTVTTLTSLQPFSPRVVGEEDAEVVVLHLPQEDDAPAALPATLRGRRSRPPTALSLAPLVIGGGAGIGTPETFAQLQRLAQKLGGAVAVSQSACAAGLGAAEQVVGLDGQQLAARHYVAIGLSGSEHHLAGLSPHTTVIALNNDPHAPIINLAQHTMIGDAMPALEALLAQLEKESQP